MLDEAALDRLIDDAIAGRPASSTDDPAAEIVAGLARLNRLRPAPAGKTKGRNRLLVRARELQKKPAVSRWRQRLTAVVAAATALTMLSGGTVYAASGSAPGDLLYPVKRAAENVSIQFKPPGAARAQAELDLARIRLAEIKILIERNDRRRIDALVGEMNGNLAAAEGRRSRLTTVERRRIKTGAISLRRAVNGALRRRPSGPSGSSNPPRKAIIGEIRKKLPPLMVRPDPAPGRLIDKARPGLRQPQPKPNTPAAPIVRPKKPRPLLLRLRGKGN